MMRNTAALAILMALGALVGCGGGGGGSTEGTSSATQVQATVLAGSGGDMSKYLGTWVSDCGYNVTGTNMGKYQTNVFQFTSVSGATATGTLTVRLYSDSTCSTSVSGAGTGLPTSVTMTYQGNLTVTSGTPADMQGNADQLTLAAAGSSTAQNYSVGFYATFSKFVQGTGSFFNRAALSYRKTS